MKKKLIITAAAVVVLVLVVWLSGYSFYTVVPMQEEGASGIVADQSDKNFDPDAYVIDIWSDIQDYSTENASPIVDVFDLYAKNKQECIDKYCIAELTEVQTASFIVTGKVKILEVNRDSKVGLMSVDVAPYDGELDAYVQIGAVYKNNVVRDEMPFIIFENFMNQLAFGDAGKAINKYIDTNVVIPMKLDDKVGQEIDITGVFADVDEIIITPVIITDAN